jgi:hypothetical protein
LYLLVPRQLAGVKCLFGDVYSDYNAAGQLYLLLSYGPEALLSVQVDQLNKGDPTPPRSIMTQRETIHPLP